MLSFYPLPRLSLQGRGGEFGGLRNGCRGQHVLFCYNTMPATALQLTSIDIMLLCQLAR